MGKTIIITTDELKNILIKDFYFYGPDCMSSIYCTDCLCKHDNKCMAMENGCPMNKDVVATYYIEKVFSNYMIPFS